MSGKIILDIKTKSLFRAIKSLPLLNVNINDTGIKFQCSDVAKYRLIELFLAKEDFVEYKKTLDARFNIPSMIAPKIIDYITKCKGNVIFYFNINELTEHVELFFYERNWQKGMNYSFPIENETQMLTNVNTRQFPSFCSMTSKTWIDTINQISLYNRNIVFQHSKNGLNFYTMDDDVDSPPKQNLRKTIKYKTMRSEALGYDAPKEDILTAIDLEFLVEGLKFIKLLSTVRIDIDHLQPLRIYQKFNIKSSMILLIASKSLKQTSDYK